MRIKMTEQAATVDVFRWLKQLRWLYLGYLVVTYFYFRDTNIRFILIDSFLAYIAIELGAFYLKKPNLLFFLLWLIFFPNNVYLYTDLVHIDRLDFYQAGSTIMTLDAMVWLKFFWAIIGILLLTNAGLKIAKAALEQLQAKYRLSNQKCLVFEILLFVLFSLGTYIGRFLRFNSINLFYDPMKILVKFWTSLDLNALAFIGMFTVFQLIVYHFTNQRDRF